MPEIERIDAVRYDVPLKGALAWGKGHELNALDHVLITVTLSDGAQGMAESTPRPTIYGETQESVLAIVADHFTPKIIGQVVNSLADIDSLDERVSIIKNNNTAKGALNMALHSALAQSQGVSLASLLNVTKDAVRVSYIVSTGGKDEVLSDVGAMFEAGVRVFKVKVGKAILQEIATIAELQNAFPSADFYVDANQCLTAENAPDVLAELHEMGVLYCEEALPVHQLLERQSLHSQTHMPLIGDDSCFTATDVERELAFDTVDIFNIKTARNGFSEGRCILNMARTANKGVMVGSQASSLLGCLHAALFSAQEGIDHATECSFYLKTDINPAHMPTLEEGYLSIASVTASLDHDFLKA
ncbi:MAG: enolase C-terminal domain-like protein [Aggregatilineales bacterium]